MSEERTGLSDVVSGLIEDATTESEKPDESGESGTQERTSKESTSAPDPIRGPQTYDPRE